MAAVPVTLVGMFVFADGHTTNGNFNGIASLSGLEVGGGPIMPTPPVDPGYGKPTPPDMIWGGRPPPIPAHPIVLPPPPDGGEHPAHPIVIPPGQPGYPAHPIVIPPGGEHPAHPIVLPPAPPDVSPAPPDTAVKPPPSDGGWAYVSAWGWGYFPGGSAAGPKRG